MVIDIGSIDGLSILLAAAASFILGGFWFAGIFSGHYARALGRESSPQEKPAPLFLVGPFLCALVTVVTSAILLHALHIDSIRGAVTFGAVVGLGYLASTTVNTAINPNIPRPLLYGLISGGYFFLSSIVVCLVLVAMR